MVEIKFNAEEFERQQQAMLARCRNASYAYNLIAAKMEARSLRCFQTESNPDGVKWKPLSDTTIMRRRKGKRQGSDRILQDTSTLRNSIQGSGKGSAKAATISTNIKYAAIHNYGGPAKAWGKKPFQMPRREFMGMSAADIKRYKETLARYIVEGT